MDVSNDSESSSNSGGHLVKDAIGNVLSSYNGFYSTPAFRRAAFTSRASSHSSLQSAHHLHYANEVESHGSRPGTPMSVQAVDYSVMALVSESSCQDLTYLPLIRESRGF